MRFLYLITVALLFVGCYRLPLKCRTEYLYPDFLASSKVLTPDTCRACYYGQQVIVTWHLDDPLCADTLVLHLRYGTREIERLMVPITRRHGYKIYRLVNSDYWCREGILSYKAELYWQGECVAEWRHHLWSEIIKIGANPLN